MPLARRAKRRTVTADGDRWQTHVKGERSSAACRRLRTLSKRQGRRRDRAADHEAVGIGAAHPVRQHNDGVGGADVAVVDLRRKEIDKGEAGLLAARQRLCCSLGRCCACRCRRRPQAGRAPSRRSAPARPGNRAAGPARLMGRGKPMSAVTPQTVRDHPTAQGLA
jgi:hypothetical protein